MWKGLEITLNIIWIFFVNFFFPNSVYFLICKLHFLQSVSGVSESSSEASKSENVETSDRPERPLKKGIHLKSLPVFLS